LSHEKAKRVRKHYSDVADFGDGLIENDGLSVSGPLDHREDIPELVQSLGGILDDCLSARD